MNVSGSGNTLGRDSGSQKSRTPGKRAYDDLAGSSLLRRTGKAAPSEESRRGNPGAALLDARRRSEAEDRIAAQLRDYYQALTREPIPDRIAALIESLEAGRVG